MAATPGAIILPDLHIDIDLLPCIKHKVASSRFENDVKNDDGQCCFLPLNLRTLQRSLR